MEQQSLYGESLAEARARVMANRDEGIRCPCCDKFAKRYQRSLSHSQVKSLVALYRHMLAHPEEPWHYVKDFDPNDGGNVFCKARYWGLVDWRPDPKDQDKKCSGYWTLTAQGVAFLRNRQPIQKYALVYNGACEGLEGELVYVEQCLQKKFSYKELMAGIPEE